MDDLKRFEFKIDKIDQRLNSIDVTLAAQHEVLKEHIRRSELNEKSVELLYKEFKPIRDNVIQFQAVISWIKVLVGSGILIEALRVILGR